MKDRDDYGDEIIDLHSKMPVFCRVGRCRYWHTDRKQVKRHQGSIASVTVAQTKSALALAGRETSGAAMRLQRIAGGSRGVARSCKLTKGKFLTGGRLLTRGTWYHTIRTSTSHIDVSTDICKPGHKPTL